MAIVNRLLDKVGGGINRSAAPAGDLEAEFGRLRDDQRLLETALKRALREIEQLRDEISDLKAGARVVLTSSPAPEPPPTPKKSSPAHHKSAPKNEATGLLPAVIPPISVDEGPRPGTQAATENESVRSKADGLRLTIDRNECIGCGTCVEHEEGVFHLNDGEGKAYVIRQEGGMDGIQDAIDACPVTCISWKPPHLATD